MSQDPNISQDLIKVLFPNLDKMIALHGKNLQILARMYIYI